MWWGVDFRASSVKDIVNLDAVPSRRHENFRREGHLVAIGVRERETVSVSLTPMVYFSAKISMSSAWHRI